MGSEDQSRAHVDRAPRIAGGSLSSITFRDSSGRDIAVQNLSTTGIGFTTESLSNPPSLGDEIHGELTLDDKRFQLHLSVKRVTGPIVGCAITSSTPSDLGANLNRRFIVEVSALRLRPIDSSILKSEPLGKPYFYVGSSDGAELYYVENNGEILDFHGSVWGHYFESKSEGHIAYGVLEKKREKGQSSSTHAASTIVHMDPKAGQEKIDIAERFISHVPGVPDQIRSKLISRLRS